MNVHTPLELINFLGAVADSHGWLKRDGKALYDERRYILTSHEHCVGVRFDPEKFQFHAQMLVDRCFEVGLGERYVYELVAGAADRGECIEKIRHCATPAQKTTAVRAVIDQMTTRLS